jgi:hypothetical protein
MLRELIILILLLNCVLLIFADYKISATLFFALAFTAYINRRHYGHLLGKELSYISARLAQLIIGISLVTFLIILLSPFSFNEVIPYYSAISLIITPVSLAYVIGKKLAVSTSQLGQFRSTRIIRCLLAISIAQILVVAISLFGLLYYSLQPALVLPQLALIGFVLALCVAMLRYDKSTHKLLKVTDRNLRIHTLSKASFKEYFGYGFLAAILVYLNYLMLFVRHNLKPDHLDPSLPLYQQATSLSVATLVVIMFLHILFERVDKHEYFINEHTLANKNLLKAFTVSLGILALAFYTPWLQYIFKTSAMDGYDWLSVVTIGVVYIALRMMKRHTRKHSRKAIIKLHKELKI